MYTYVCVKLDNSLCLELIYTAEMQSSYVQFHNYEWTADRSYNTVNAPDSVTVTPDMALKCLRCYHSLCEVATLSQYVAAAWHSSKVLHHVVQN